MGGSSPGRRNQERGQASAKNGARENDGGPRTTPDETSAQDRASDLSPEEGLAHYGLDVFLLRKLQLPSRESYKKL